MVFTSGKFILVVVDPVMFVTIKDQVVIASPPISVDS